MTNLLTIAGAIGLGLIIAVLLAILLILIFIRVIKGLRSEDMLKRAICSLIFLILMGLLLDGAGLLIAILVLIYVNLTG